MYLRDRISVWLALCCVIAVFPGCATLTHERSLDQFTNESGGAEFSEHSADVVAADFEADLGGGFDILQDTPRELSKVVLPSYTLEPPDILFLEAVQVIPKEPYHLQTGDVVSIQVPDAFEESPIEGAYAVGPGGIVELGAPYGSVRVGGRTLTEARDTIVEHLTQHLRPEFLTTVSVNLVQSVGKQQVEGQHLVGPDGTVTLGTYGSVLVVGMTVAQAKDAIERHLSQFLEAPEVSVDVFSYNSKVFYVITQGAGLGDSVTRLPITGNETVLDAMADVAGLTEVSSKRIWIARPGCNVHGEYQILPVDWKAITELADVRTNYQIMPGDRVLIGENKWVAFDNSLAKLVAPVERAMGFSILGVDTLTRFSGRVLAGGGNRFNQGGGGLIVP